MVPLWYSPGLEPEETSLRPSSSLLLEDSRESSCFKASSRSPQPASGRWGVGGSFIPRHSASDQHSWALETSPGVTFSRTDFHFSGNKTLVLFVVTQKRGETWKMQKNASRASVSAETTAFPWGK